MLMTFCEKKQNLWRYQWGNKKSCKPGEGWQNNRKKKKKKSKRTNNGLPNTTQKTKDCAIWSSQTSSRIRIFITFVLNMRCFLSFGNRSGRAHRRSRSNKWCRGCNIYETFSVQDVFFLINSKSENTSNSYVFKLSRSWTILFKKKIVVCQLHAQSIHVP